MSAACIGSFDFLSIELKRYLLFLVDFKDR